MPAVEESFCLKGPYVSPYGHFRGLDDAGELAERHGPIGSHHFEDQLATFCSEHETDSNVTGRYFSALCAELQKMRTDGASKWYERPRR